MGLWLLRWSVGAWDLLAFVVAGEVDRGVRMARVVVLIDDDGFRGGVGGVGGRARRLDVEGCTDQRRVERAGQGEVMDGADTIVGPAICRKLSSFRAGIAGVQTQVAMAVGM